MAHGPIFPPVFVLCAPRTGSTLLRYILDSHPDICAPPELYLADLIRPLYKLLYHTTASPAVTGSDDETARVARVREGTRRIICEHLDAYVQKKGKRMWCDKSPGVTVMEIDRVLEVFPDARFISLHRTCLDMVLSSVEFSQFGWILPGVVEHVRRNPEHVLDAVITAWMTMTERQLALEERLPEQCFRLRYEDLVTAPAEVLPRVMSFLGVGWNDAMLDGVFTSNHDDRGRAGDFKIMFTDRIKHDSIGRGASIPFHLIAPEVARRMNALVERLGYPPAGAASTRAPAKPPVAVAAATPIDAAALDALFAEALPKRIAANRAAADQIRGSCKFVVDDRPDQVWVIDPSVVAQPVTRGDRAAACTVHLAATVLADLVARRVNPVAAFREGKLRVDGDTRTAALFYQVLFL